MEKNERGAVLLAERGLLRVLSFTGNVVGTDLSAIDAASLLSEKNGEPRFRILIVIAICANPRMVLANENGEPGLDHELVDLSRNKNFVIGDRIQVEKHEAQQGAWQLVSKLPRTDRRPSVEGFLRDP